MIVMFLQCNHMLLLFFKINCKWVIFPDDGRNKSFFTYSIKCKTSHYRGLIPQMKYFLYIIIIILFCIYI